MAALQDHDQGVRAKRRHFRCGVSGELAVRRGQHHCIGLGHTADRLRQARAHQPPGFGHMPGTKVEAGAEIENRDGLLAGVDDRKRLGVDLRHLGRRHLRHIRAGGELAGQAVLKHINRRPAELDQPRCRHHRAHLLAVDQHHAGVLHGHIFVGRLDQLAAGRMAAARAVAGEILRLRANVDDIGGARAVGDEALQLSRGNRPDAEAGRGGRRAGLRARQAPGARIICMGLAALRELKSRQSPAPWCRPSGPSPCSEFRR